MGFHFYTKFFHLAVIKRSANRFWALAICAIVARVPENFYLTTIYSAKEWDSGTGKLSSKVHAHVFQWLHAYSVLPLHG